MKNTTKQNAKPMTKDIPAKGPLKNKSGDIEKSATSARIYPY